MERVVVTGGSGRTGRAVVRDLIDHGYRVVNVDVAPPPERLCWFLQADLTDYGQAIDALRHADAVIHLAAVPSPGRQTDERTFRTNVTSTYNVFAAATLLKVRRVVWSSSETALGLPVRDAAPHYAPVDEDHFPHPGSAYALSKVVGEQMAEHFARWSGIAFVSLRFSNVLGEEEYRRDFPQWWENPSRRRSNLWGYIDERDAAQSCRLALTADIAGHEAFNIAAADTCMNRPTRELLAAHFPDIELRRPLGEFEALLSSDKARRLLTYAPRHSWRDVHDGHPPAGAASR